MLSPDRVWLWRNDVPDIYTECYAKVAGRPFYTDCYTAEYYTQEGLDWIDASSFKTVILRHYPELAATGLGNIKNAFEPWDTGKKLDPARHPLRGWDKSFKGNPCTGDAAKR